MIVEFSNPYLEQLYIGIPLKGKPKFPAQIIDKFQKRVEILKQVENADELSTFKSLHFERLKGNKNHLHSIRINDQYRLEFELNNKTVLKLADIAFIEDISKHYE